MMQISEREDGAIATGQSFNSTKTCKNTFNAPLSWSINGQMSSNHAKSCKFSVRKLGAQPDGPGVTWSGLQARTPWPRQTRIWGVESVWKVWNQSVWSRDVLSAEIHRNPSPNLPWCQHPEPFSPQCTKLSGPWSFSIWRKMLHIKDLHSSTIQGLSCLNREQTWTYWKKIYSCVEIARSCLGPTQWFRF